MIQAIFLTIPLLAASPALADVTPSVDAWCKDSATFCLPGHGTSLSGLRLIADFSLNLMLQGGDNRFEQDLLKQAPRFGVEVNLYGGWVMAQAVFIPPLTLKLDPSSPLVLDGRLVKESRELGVDWGGGVGLSFLEGILAGGVGVLSYDRRQIVNPTQSELWQPFVYLNFNPVALARYVGPRVQQ